MLDPEPKPRFPVGKAPMLPAGTLFWLDEDDSVREKRYCATCRKPLLVMWSFKTLPKVTCKSCASK